MLLMTVIIHFLSCGRQEPVEKQVSNLQKMPDQELWNSEIVFSKNEKVASILKAKHISIYEDPELTIADSRFTLDIFNSEGEHTSVLSADSGVVCGEDSLKAFRNVVVISDSGVTLNTERLFWNRKLKQVVSDTFVVLTTETDTLYGDSLVSDEALENWVVFNPRGKTVRVLDKKK